MIGLFELVETNIGAIRARIDNGGRLIVENQSPRLSIFLPGNDFRVLGEALVNPNRNLLAISPEKFKGEWEFMGRDHSSASAYESPSFIFIRFSGNK